MAILPGCFLRAFASELSPLPPGEPLNGATEDGRVGGSEGRGLFERSKDPDPNADNDILDSLLGVLGDVACWYVGMDGKTSLPIGICTFVLLSSAPSCIVSREVASTDTHGERKSGQKTYN